MTERNGHGGGAGGDDVSDDEGRAVAVVVCSLNGAAKLVSCLDAIAGQTIARRLEVVVVDDGSTDGTGAVARAWGRRRGRDLGRYDVVEHPSNLGLAAARNTGVNAGDAEIVAFTDDDCVPGVTWAEELARRYLDPGVAAVGGSVHPLQTDTYARRYLAVQNPLAPLEAELGHHCGVLYRLWLYLRDNQRPPAQTHQRPVFSLVGANFSVRRRVLEEVGGFDDRIRFAGEEEDLCRRIGAAGLGVCLFDPSNRVRHDFEPTLVDTVRRSYAYGRGSARSYLKNPGHLPKIFPLPVIICGLVLASCRWRRLLWAGLALPAVANGRHVVDAITRGQPERLGYPYVQLLQETMTSVGFMAGYGQLRSSYVRRDGAISAEVGADRTLRMVMVTPYPPRPDGIGFHAQALVRSLPGWVTASVLTTRSAVPITRSAMPIASSTVPVTASPDGPAGGRVDVERVASLSPFGLWRSVRALRRGGVDVVHVQFACSLLGGPFLVAVVAALVAKVRYSVPLVVTDHEVRREIDILGRVGRWVHRAIGRAADAIIVYTEESERLLVEECSVSASKVVRMPHGMVGAGTDVVGSEPEGPPLLVSFGFIHPDKGTEHLIEAVGQLVRAGRHPGLRLVVAGAVRSRTGLFRWFGRNDEQYQQRLVALTERCGVADQVEFSGYLSDEDLGALLKGSTLVVAPYLRSTQSGALNLAAGAGAAIVASDLPGLRESLGGGASWVTPGQTGELATAIARLLERPLERRALRSCVRTLHAEQSMPVVAGRLASVYARLAGAG